MDNLLLKHYQRSHSEIKNKFLNYIHEGNLVSINVCMWGFFVINWKLIEMKLLAFFHFISLSIKFFCFVFFEENFGIYSFVTYSKIKDKNKSHLPNSIHISLVMCVKHWHHRIFSDRESLIYQPRSPIYRCRPCMDFLFIIEKKYQQPSNISHTLLHQISINSNYLIPARTSLSSNQINKQRNTYLLCHLLG